MSRRDDEIARRRPAGAAFEPGRARPPRRRGAAWGALIACVLLAVAAVAVLGNAGAKRTGVAQQSSRGTTHWLVPTAGAAPSVAAENEQQGTTAWQLPSTAKQSALSVYVSAQSILPGQTEKVYVNSPGAAWVRAEVFRMGWYGGRGGRRVLETDRLAPTAQPPCHHDDTTGLTECRWRPTLSFAVPESLTSGVYVVKLTDSTGNQRDSLFVLEAAKPAPMLAQIPIATYEAYNNWGGDSLYPGYQLVRATGTRQGVEVSFDRPYDSITGAGQFFKGDVAMVRFLEKQGYPLSYTTSTSLDARPDQLAGRRVVVDVGHAEYWSARAASAFESARSRGTNLVFMSSDTLAWRVRYAPATSASSEAGRPDHRIVAYKEYASRDPNRSEPTGAFPDLGATLTASAFDNCITPGVPGSRYPVYHYYSWHPSPSLQPDWLYRGTGFTPTSTVAGIVGYELDSRTSLAPVGTIVVGSGSAPCKGGPGVGVATTTLYRTAAGGLVFSTGTLGWQFGLSPLPSASPYVPRTADPRLERLTDNLLRHTLGG